MGERGSLANRVHLLLTVVLAGALLTLALLAAFGVIEIRRVDKADKVDNPAPGARIAPTEGVDKFFKTLGDEEAYCFKYEGAWIDCWIEVDKDGVKSRPWEASGKLLRAGQGEQGQAGGTPSGYLVWVRRKRKDHEEWSTGVSAFSAVDKEGQSSGRLYASGISSPPLPQGVTSGGSYALPSGGSLQNAKEITLMAFTVHTFDADKKVKVEWSASLKCKAVE
jgi:hypothetical protein